MQISYSIISHDQKTIKILKDITKDVQIFECLYTAEEEDDAMNDTLKFNPSFIFLDLDNPNINNPFLFVKELYSYLEILPQFIAISKSKAAAYEVIKNNFIDYLLKPLTELETRKSLMKIKKTERIVGSKVCVKSYSDYKFLDLSEILYLKADNNTTDFYLLNEKKISAFKTLGHFENFLPTKFVRVHHSFIVNADLIYRINYGKSRISLKGIQTIHEVPFSKTYRDQVNLIRDSLLNKHLVPQEN